MRGSPSIKIIVEVVVHPEAGYEPLSGALRSLLDGAWDILKDSWGVLEVTPFGNGHIQSNLRSAAGSMMLIVHPPLHVAQLSFVKAWPDRS